MDILVQKLNLISKPQYHLYQNRIRCSFLLSSKSVKTCIVTYSSIHRIQADYQSFTYKEIQTQTIQYGHQIPQPR